MRRLVRFVLLAGVAAAVVAAIRALTREADPLPAPGAPRDEPWPPLRPETSPAPRPAPEPSGVAPEPAGVPVADPPEPDAGTNYSEPTPSGGCPDGFPIKAKMSSKIYHSPGQLNYDRTTPDRCYTDAAAAEADGLRAAKR